MEIVYQHRFFLRYEHPSKYGVQVFQISTDDLNTLVEHLNQIKEIYKDSSSLKNA